jgi:hypothetical protein
VANSEDFTRYLTIYGNKIQNIWPSGEKIYDCFGLCDVLTAFKPPVEKVILLGFQWYSLF